MNADNPTSGQKLHFYGGSIGAFLPFGIFAFGVIAIALSGAPDERGFWPVLLAALTAGMLLAKDRKAFSETVIAGMAQPIVMIMLMAWMLARLCRSTYLARTPASPFYRRIYCYRLCYLLHNFPFHGFQLRYYPDWRPNPVSRRRPSRCRPSAAGWRHPRRSYFWGLFRPHFRYDDRQCTQPGSGNRPYRPQQAALYPAGRRPCPTRLLSAGQSGLPFSRKCRGAPR